MSADSEHSIDRMVICSHFPANVNHELTFLFHRWISKSEVLMMFWEYFHKKLNSSFFVSGTAPSSLAVTRYAHHFYHFGLGWHWLGTFIFSNSGQGYIDQIHKLLNNEHLNANMSSFSIFLNSLGKALKRLVENDLKNQIQKIMGTKSSLKN